MIRATARGFDGGLKSCDRAGEVFPSRIEVSRHLNVEICSGPTCSTNLTIVDILHPEASCRSPEQAANIHTAVRWCPDRTSMNTKARLQYLRISKDRVSHK